MRFSAGYKRTLPPPLYLPSPTPTLFPQNKTLLQNGFKAAADTSLYEGTIFFLFTYCLDYKRLEYRPSREITTSQFPTQPKFMSSNCLFCLKHLQSLFGFIWFAGPMLDSPSLKPPTFYLLKKPIQ